MLAVSFSSSSVANIFLPVTLKAVRLKCGFASVPSKDVRYARQFARKIIKKNRVFEFELTCHVF